MAAAVKLRTDYSAFDLRRLAAGSKHASQSRRLLLLAAALEGMDREQPRGSAAWIARHCATGSTGSTKAAPDGLKDIRSTGQPPRLSTDQLAALATIVETGPNRAVDGVVRWRASICRRSFASASASIITSARSGSS